MDDITVRNRLNGRALDGRFGADNKVAVGRGNPVHRRMSELRREALQSETPERVARVIAKMLSLAEEGDIAAARVYLDTVIGKAPQAMEISGLDGASLGVNIAQIQAVILQALAGPEFVAARVTLARHFKDIVDAGGA